MDVITAHALDTHLLGIWDVTGIGQNKSAKLVKIFYCPPPFIWRTETLKQSSTNEMLTLIIKCERTDMVLTLNTTDLSTTTLSKTDTHISM